MGTAERERLCFRIVPRREPRFLYSSHSGVACHRLPAASGGSSPLPWMPRGMISPSWVGSKRKRRRLTARRGFLAGVLILLWFPYGNSDCSYLPAFTLRMTCTTSFVLNAPRCPQPGWSDLRMASGRFGSGRSGPKTPLQTPHRRAPGNPGLLEASPCLPLIEGLAQPKCVAKGTPDQ
jgi:hypothetical protein